MKSVQAIVFSLATLVFAGLTYAQGVDSSGGGGAAGHLQLSSGFAPGAFSVTLRSDATGALSTVLKYLKVAGAKPVPTNDGTSYVLGQASIFESKKALPTSVYFHQMQMTIAYADINSVTTAGARTQLEFRGPVAEALYAGMEKGGAEIIAKNLDRNRQVMGMSYFEGKSLGCDKRGPEGLRGGISCSIYLATPKVEKPEQHCPECGG